MSPKYGKEVENSTYRFLYIYTHIIYIYCIIHICLERMGALTFAVHSVSWPSSVPSFFEQNVKKFEMDLYTGANLQ